jgi:hypothetical protein
MFYPFHPRHALVIGVAVCALSSAAAKADVIYTVTTTGTISSGTSDGTFGANGTNLAGDTFTATATFDATLSVFGGGQAEDFLHPASSSASITVSSNTYNISSNSNSKNEYNIGSRSGGYPYDQIFSQTYTSAGTAYFSENIYTSELTFLSNDSLSQTLYYAVPSSGFNHNSASFDAPDGTTFSGTVSTISVNGGAPVPEPRSVALFGAGLAGLAWLRRRSAV